MLKGLLNFGLTQLFIFLLGIAVILWEPACSRYSKLKIRGLSQSRPPSFWKSPRILLACRLRRWSAITPSRWRSRLCHDARG